MSAAVITVGNHVSSGLIFLWVIAVGQLIEHVHVCAVTVFMRFFNFASITIVKINIMAVMHKLWIKHLIVFLASTIIVDHCLSLMSRLAFIFYNSIISSSFLRIYSFYLDTALRVVRTLLLSTWKIKALYLLIVWESWFRSFQQQR